MSLDLRQPCGCFARPRSRREFLARAGAGFGVLALADLLCGSSASAAAAAAAEEARDPAAPLAPRAPHFAPRARNVIWLFMEGAPSAVDLFDPKPALDQADGKRISIDVFNGNPGPLMKSPFSFKRYGRSGAWVCDKSTHVAKHVDDIAFVNSCFTASNDHGPALYQLHTVASPASLPTRGA